MDGQISIESTANGETDLSEFAPYLKGLELTEDQQTELLQTLWGVMSAFADYGFGIEPTQMICGWIEETRSQPPISAADKVELKGRPTTKTFNGAARNTLPPAGKESS